MNNPVMEALMLARANERLAALNYAPRSWSNDAKLAFLHLPPDLQNYYASREKARDREVRRAQNDRAEALRKLALAETRCAELEARIAERNDPSESCTTGKDDALSKIQDTAA